MKPLQIVFLGLLAGLGPLAIDLYLPSNNVVALAFDVDVATASLNISLFFLGMAVGSFISGPISDAYGRKPLLIVSLLIFIAASILATVATSISLLILMRSSQAIGAGMLAVLVQAIISDRCDETVTARMLSLTTLISISLRLLAPIAGAYLVSGFGWQSPLLVMAGMAILCLFYFLTQHVESHPPEKRASFRMSSYFANFSQIIRHPRARMFVAFEVISSIGLLAFVTGAALVFMDTYQISSTRFGYLYTGITVVIILSAYCNNLLVGRLGIERMMWWTIWGMAICSAILLSLSLLVQLPLWLITILFCAYLTPLMMTRINATAGAIKCLPNFAGTTASLIGTIGLALGGLIGVEMGLLYQISKQALVMILFACALGNLSLFIASTRAGVLTGK